MTYSLIHLLLCSSLGHSSCLHFHLPNLYECLKAIAKFVLLLAPTFITVIRLLTCPYEIICNLRGLVSGATIMIPCSAAVRCAPAFVIKFCSVQVRP